MSTHDDQLAGTVAEQHPQRPEGTLHRREVGTAAEQRLHPPHLTENDQEGSAPAPALPANAHGSDRVSSAEQNRGIDKSSMYDRRPEEDKNQPPSERSEE